MGMCLAQWSGRYKSTREKQILYNPRQLEEREFVMGRQQQHTHIQFSGEWPMETFGFVKLRIIDEAWGLSARSNSPHEDRPCGSQSLCNCIYSFFCDDIDNP